jgi:hypothetical protein
MTNPEPLPIAEWCDVDDDTARREIFAQYRPAVLRGFAGKWPAVRHAMESAESICRYLAAFDNGTPVDAIMMAPEVQGRIFYKEDMEGFNYLRNRVAVSAVIEQLTRYARFPTAPSVAVQSALIADCLPGFSAENRLTVLDASILPRIWIGNTVTTPAHFDQSNNIACVVAGKRRFTLFPPEQVANLYIGPLEYAPTRTPISMVSFKNPDFMRFPKFKEALAAAQFADLEPGDAIYIPSMWWHHVVSTGPLNILVNYWWGSPGEGDGENAPESPFDCLLHCLRNMKHLPPEHRAAWAAMFDHYLFNVDGDPSEHIPAHKRGVLGR